MNPLNRSLSDKLNVLVVGAHPDDFEIGCSGTIIKYKDFINLHVAIFSDRMDTGELRNWDEVYESFDILGIDRDSMLRSSIPTRIFSDYRVAIRNKLLRLKTEHKVDIVFVHSKHDLHQDHQVLTEEVLRIFRDKTIIGYEVLRSGFGFDPNMHVSLTHDIVDKKIKAIMCYKSQFTSTKSGAYYFDEQIIRGLMLARGGFYGVTFAEAFEVYCLKL